MRLLVVAAAAGEVGGRRMIGAGQGAIADAVAIHVLVAGELAQALQVFPAEHLAAVDGLFGIGERLRHPVVHAQVEVGEHEHRSLEFFGQVEGVAGHAEALGHGGGKQQDVPGVAMGEEGGGEHVALRGARGQAGGGPDALNVPDDGGHLDVVTEPGELRHERNAGTGGGGHGARAGPAGAQGHAHGGELVLGLHDGESGFAVLTDAVFLHVVDEGFDERRRGRDGIPGDHGDAGEHGAQRGGRVAVDDDLAAGLVHALDGEGIGLGERGSSVVVARLGGVDVEVGGLDLAAELLANGLLHLRRIEAEQAGDDADVDHVLDQLAQLGFRTDGGHQLVERNRIEGQVVAEGAQVEGLVIEHGGAGGKGHHVFGGSLGVHRHQEINFLLAGDVTLLAGANGVPGGQAGDVGGEQVLAGNGHAHLENGAQQDGVGGLRAGTVHRGHLQGKVVDHGLAFDGAGKLLRSDLSGSHELPSFEFTCTDAGERWLYPRIIRHQIDPGTAEYAFRGRPGAVTPRT